MKKGNEIGMSPIKCDNKSGTEKLRAIHVNINDILFEYGYKYISPADAEYIYNQLCAYGKELKDLEVPEKALAKKNELLAKLRTVCTAVNDYRKSITLTAADLPQVSATTKYYTAQYLKAKKENALEDDKIMSLLKEHKRISDNMIQPLINHFNPNVFNKIPEELITILRDRYDPNFIIVKW